MKINPIGERVVLKSVKAESKLGSLSNSVGEELE